MNVERLERLVTIMEEVEEKEEKTSQRLFGLSSWFGCRKADGLQLDNEDCVIDGMDQFTKCGTTACALGWASLDPEFNEQGLRALKIQGGFMYPTYNGLLGIHAAQEFFHLDRDQAYYLFMPSGYEYNEGFSEGPIKPREVIEHIKNLLDGVEITIEV